MKYNRKVRPEPKWKMWAKVAGNAILFVVTVAMMYVLIVIACVI